MVQMEATKVISGWFRRLSFLLVTNIASVRSCLGGSSMSQPSYYRKHYNQDLIHVDLLHTHLQGFDNGRSNHKSGCEIRHKFTNHRNRYKQEWTCYFFTSSSRPTPPRSVFRFSGAGQTKPIAKQHLYKSNVSMPPA